MLGFVLRGDKLRSWIFVWFGFMNSNTTVRFGESVFSVTVDSVITALSTK